MVTWTIKHKPLVSACEVNWLFKKKEKKKSQMKKKKIFICIKAQEERQQKSAGRVQTKT